MRYYSGHIVHIVHILQLVRIAHKVHIVHAVHVVHIVHKVHEVHMGHIMHIVHIVNIAYIEKDVGPWGGPGHTGGLLEGRGEGPLGAGLPRLALRPHYCPVPGHGPGPKGGNDCHTGMELVRDQGRQPGHTVSRSAGQRLILTQQFHI